jgi:hypothetical protein
MSADTVAGVEKIWKETRPFQIGPLLSIGLISDVSTNRNF